MTEGTVQVNYATSNEVFEVILDTAAGMTSNIIAEAIKQFPRRLVGASCIMIGAGAAADTVKLQKVTAAAVTTDISDAVDVSAKANKATFSFGTLDIAQMDLNNGDYVQLLTVSDALVRVQLKFIRLQATP